MTPRQEKPKAKVKKDNLCNVMCSSRSTALSNSGFCVNLVTEAGEAADES